MPTHRYVVADVFTDTPLTGNHSPSSPTHAASATTGCRRWRGVGFSETVFVLPAEAAETCGSASLRPSSSFHSPAIRPWARPSSSVRRSARGDRPRDRPRNVPGRARARRVAAHRVRLDDQPVPAIKPYDDVDRSSPHCASRAPSSRSSSTTTAPATSSSALPSEEPWLPCARRCGGHWLRSR